MRRTVVLILVCLLTALGAASYAAQLEKLKNVDFQVFNKTKEAIFVVVDNDRGDNTGEMATADGKTKHKGIKVDAEKDGTLNHGANVGDEPTVHIWGVSGDKLTKEIYPNPPKWPTVDPAKNDITRHFHFDWDGNTLTKK